MTNQETQKEIKDIEKFLHKAVEALNHKKFNTAKVMLNSISYKCNKISDSLKVQDD